MPDTMQINDYLEKVNNPSDFATLRQKHQDGMYNTLEQFENDVYTVFRKAMEINSKNTIPYKEAISLQDQAKKIFQSLKNDRTYSELELSAWHNKYFRGRKRTRRNDGNAPLCYSIQTRPCLQSDTRADMEANSNTLIENERKKSFNGGRRRTRNTPARSPKETDSLGHAQTSIEERRCTHNAMDKSNSPLLSISGTESPNLIFNNFAPSYEESLQLFVKNAGKEAKTVADLKCQEYNEREQYYNFAKMPSFSPQVDSQSTAVPFNRPPNLVPASNEIPSRSFFYPNNLINTPNCRLETEDLLDWFSLIGTPQFLERGNGISISDSNLESTDLSLFSNSNLSESRLPVLNKMDKSEFLERGKSVFISDSSKESTDLSLFSNSNNPRESRPLNLKKTDKAKQLSNLSNLNLNPRELRIIDLNEMDRSEPSIPSSSNGVVSSQLGFGQFARSVQPFKLNSRTSFKSPNGS